MNDLSSTTNISITKISYSSTNINSISVRNNSNEIVHLYYDGNEILTLNPEQVGTANLNISLIN
ncbi:hypothetical protein IKS57_00850 [bacterium]|nr:hypothetical protein [bacterium]